MYYPDGSVYEGEWKRDLQHGHGRYAYPNGDLYEGGWQRGQRHGIGTYQFAEAKVVFRGTWKCGIRDGPAEVIFRRHRFHGTWQGEDPIGPAAYSYACKSMALGYVRMVATNAADGVIGEENAAEASGGDGDGLNVKFSKVSLRNEPGMPRVCEPLWRIQQLEVYDFARLPPEPMPLPLVDSEDDECDVTPVPSEDELIEFDQPPGEEEGEAEENGEEALDEGDFGEESMGAKAIDAGGV